MNYVKSLAKQLAPKGIRVNAAAPGPIWTPLQVSNGATQENLRSSAARPRAAPVSPAADASYATGQVYGSAGGSGQP
jgi:NAD(P)-dependent dehydrogenase (short-subunit alcohol dehydrogenase family)